MLVLGNIRQRQQRDLQDMQAPAGDVLAADWSEARESNPIEAYSRLADLDIAQNGYTAWAMSETAGVGLDPSWQEPATPELSQEQAQARVEAAGLTGHLEIPESGMREGALDILISRKKTELGRQSVWNRSPGGLLLGVARLGTGLAASMTDPVNIGLAFMPVVSGARYASWLASKSTALGRFGVRAGVGAIEGAAGAAVVEPLILASKTRDQSEYGLLDSFMNVTFGSLMGGGLHAAGGLVGDALRRRGATGMSAPPGSMERVMALMPLEAKQAVMAQGIGAIVEGGAPQPGAVLDALAQQDSRVRRVIEQESAALLAARRQVEGEIAGLNADLGMEIPPGYEVLAEVNPGSLGTLLWRRGYLDRDPAGAVQMHERGGGVAKLILKHGDVTDAELAALPEVLRDRAPANDFGVTGKGRNEGRQLDWRVNFPDAQVTYRVRVREGEGKGKPGYIVSVFRNADPATWKAESEVIAGGAPGSLGGTGADQDTAQAFFQIQKPGSQGAPAPENVGSSAAPGKIDPEVSFWQGEVKRLRTEAVEPAKSESLFSFVKQRGGIRPDDLEGSEVKAVTAGKTPPGFFSKAGRNADDLALAAWEAGYIGTEGGERPTLREFYDALDREARGQRVFPAGRADDFAAARAYRDAVEEALDSVGLSLNDDPVKVATALADLQRKALAEAQADLPTYARETEDPAYLESSAAADAVVREVPKTAEARRAQLEEMLAASDQDLQRMRDAGELDEESEAAITLAEKALADARDHSAAAQQGAVCMTRNT